MRGVVLIAAVLLLASCARQISVQEIVDGVLEAQENVRAFEVEMEMTSNRGGEIQGEVFDRVWGRPISGALDLENRKMRLDYTDKGDLSWSLTWDGGNERRIMISIIDK